MTWEIICDRLSKDLESRERDKLNQQSPRNTAKAPVGWA